MKGHRAKVMWRSVFEFKELRKSEFYEFLDIACEFCENLSAEITLVFIKLRYFSHHARDQMIFFASSCRLIVSPQL